MDDTSTAVAPIAPVTLSRPITSFGEQVTDFQMREPKGDEIRRIGSVIVFTADGGYDFNMDRVAKYVVALATPPISPNAVNTIAPGDWLPIAGALAPFFMPSPPSG